MTEEKGGPLSSQDLQRQTIAKLARQRAMRSYDDRMRSFSRTRFNDATYRASAIPPRPATNTTPSSTVAPSQPPINPQLPTSDLQKYHSAWQDYYKKYYGEYYQRAAKAAIEKDRLSRAKVDMEKSLKEQDMGLRRITKASLGEDLDESTLSEEDRLKVFKASIQRKAKLRAKKMRKSRHFIPIFLGLLILIAGLLFQYNQVIIANVVAYMSPGNSEVKNISEIDPSVSVKTNPNPTLIIPKLNIEAPINFGSKNDVASMMTAMGNGVAHFSMNGASAVPGELGNFVISGHSAGNVYERSNYKFIFSGLTRMTKKDLAYVDYEGKRYTYSIAGTKVVEPNDTQALVDIANSSDKPMLTLLTCTPLGTSRYRLLVYGEQINPEYKKQASNSNLTNERPKRQVADATSMPSNSASPLVQFWRWLIGSND